MIEAKDTVMNNKEVENELGKHCYPSPKYWDEIDLVRRAQAEITWPVSFKAGYDKRESEFVYNPDYLDFPKGVKTGRKLGIRSVVEWGNEECIEHPTCETTVLLRRECDKCWQAQKKKWGI